MSYLTLLGGLGGKKQAFLNLPEAPAVSGPSNQEPHNRPPQSGCYEVPVTIGASGFSGCRIAEVIVVFSFE